MTFSLLAFSSQNLSKYEIEVLDYRFKICVNIITFNVCYVKLESPKAAA